MYLLNDLNATYCVYQSIEEIQGPDSCAILTMKAPI